MSSLVPAGWQLAPLSDHGSRIRNRNGIGNTNVLTASAKDGLVNQREYFNKSVASADISHYTLLRKGDFAYNKSYSHGYPVGVVRRLERYDLGVLSPLYICFSIESNECDETYLSYYFDSHRFERELNSVVQEGARAHGLLNIPVNDFFDRELLLPPLPEQKKIASILTSVDKVIENTQIQIDKLQDLKKATMNELLTKGIGHTEFKDSELGRIPKSWYKSNLDEITRTVFSNVDKKSYEDETPVLLCNYMDVYRHLYITNSIKFMSATAKKREIEKFSLEYDDVMITKDSETPEDIAVPAHVSEELEGVLCGYHLALIRTDKQKLSGGFLCHLLSLNSIQRRFYRLANGSTRFGLTSESINKAEIAIPPLFEQRKIASILTSMDKTIEEHQRKLAQTQSLKKSLMQDLLTGKVRVTVN